MKRRRRDGYIVYRRRAHLVVWDARMVATIVPWDLYFCPSLGCTFARVLYDGEEGLWLPCRELIGYYHFLTGDIIGARIMDGWGPDGMPMPMCDVIVPDLYPDSWGYRHYRSDRRRLWPQMPNPMAHT